jgi:6-phosphogluconolactonase (cycloisomerase 2 family)
MPLANPVRQLCAAACFIILPLTLCAQSGSAEHSIPAGSQAKFLYAATGDLPNILLFQVSANGALSGPTYTSLPAGSGPEMVVADPAGKFLFAIEYQGILAFTIDSQTGGLTLVPGSPFPTGGYGDYPTAIGIDPGGNFVYVTISDVASPMLAAYRINRTTGVLTEAEYVAVLNFGIHPTPTSVQTDPSGKFIYLVDPGSGAIAGYLVNLSNGNIGRGLFPGPFAAGLGATVISGSADFFYVFARDQVPNLIGYSFNHTSGELRPVPGTFFFPQPDSANYSTVDPVHNVLYQPNFGGSIAAYKILQNGALHFANMTAVGQVMSPETLLVDASGTFLFAVGASASYERAPPQVTSFQIDPVTGNLTFAGASQSFNSLNYYSSLAAAR